MTAPKSLPGSASASAKEPNLFWITRDRASHLRLLRGSVSLPVPVALHDLVRDCDCENWCLDNLEEGLLVEWSGLELIFHFATASDAILFKLRWF